MAVSTAHARRGGHIEQKGEVDNNKKEEETVEPISLNMKTPSRRVSCGLSSYWIVLCVHGPVRCTWPIAWA